MAKVARKGALGQLGDRPGQLDPGRTSADDDEGHQPPALRIAVGNLRALEGKQDAPTDFQCIVQAFQGRCMPRPLVMAEIGVFRTGSDDEVIVAVATPSGVDQSPRSIDLRYLLHEALYRKSVVRERVCQ